MEDRKNSKRQKNSAATSVRGNSTSLTPRDKKISFFLHNLSGDERVIGRESSPSEMEAAVESIIGRCVLVNYPSAD